MRKRSCAASARSRTIFLAATAALSVLAVTAWLVVQLPLGILVGFCLRRASALSTMELAVSIAAESISVKGSLGTLVRPVNSLVTVKNEDGKLLFAPANE